MTYRNEYDLVAQMRRAIRAEYPQAWELKTASTGYQRPGVPDLLICLHGRLIAIEAKHQKPGESLPHMFDRVSAIQRVELAELRHAGAEAFVCWTVAQALAILERVDREVEDETPDRITPSVAYRFPPSGLDPATFRP